MRGWSWLALGLSLAVGVRGADESSATAIPIRPVVAAEAAQVSYARHVKPLLERKCRMCHAPDAAMSGLDVTSVAALRKPAQKAGPAVVPGQPDESPLVQYVRGLRQPAMPLRQPPLTAEELHTLRSWIAAGAVDDSGAAVAPPELVVTAALRAVDPELRRGLSARLSSRNAEERFLARRTLRVAQLAPVTAPVTTERAIDHFIAAKWKQAKLPEAAKPPVMCDDGAFLRRVYTDVVGVLPTEEETGSFLVDKAPDKRARLVDELLARREDYAAHWTPFWEDALGSGSSAGVGGIAYRGNYQGWIYDSLKANKPYDLFVAELIDPTLPGRPKATELNANGKIITSAFVRNENYQDTIQTAATAGQVFLGTGMKCASCHSHFTNPEWSQARFLGFASLFAAEDLELIRCEQRSGQFVKAAFPFPLPEAAAAGAPAKLEQRLQRVAEGITDPFNPRFAKTIVNRLWKRYLGLGLFEPADDFRLDQPASHPELLEWLADDFIRSGYDLQHTTRLILNSQTYQFAYDARREDHFDLAKPTEPRYWRSPQLRRLTAEPVIDSLRLISAQTLDRERRVYRDNASTALTRALGRPASRGEISTSRPNDVAVVQSLELLNGDEFHRLIYSAPVLEELAAERDARVAVGRLYQMTLQRAPRRDELKRALAHVRTQAAAASGDGQDAVWIEDDPPVDALLGSNGPDRVWQWVEQPAHGGLKARRQEGDGVQWHQLFRAPEPLSVTRFDTLFTWVHLDAARPPKRITMGFSQTGRAEFPKRVTWGEPLAGTEHLGPLPAVGQWVRLEVPGRLAVRPDGRGLAGWRFEQDGGVVHWDASGMRRGAVDPKVEPWGDLLWALAIGPEFQYVR